MRQDALERDHLLEAGGAQLARQEQLRHAAHRQAAQNLVAPES